MRLLLMNTIKISIEQPKFIAHHAKIQLEWFAADMNYCQRLVEGGVSCSV